MTAQHIRIAVYVAVLLVSVPLTQGLHGSSNDQHSGIRNPTLVEKSDAPDVNPRSQFTAKVTSKRTSELKRRGASEPSAHDKTSTSEKHRTKPKAKAKAHANKSKPRARRKDSTKTKSKQRKGKRRPKTKRARERARKTPSAPRDSSISGRSVASGVRDRSTEPDGDADSNGNDVPSEDDSGASTDNSDASSHQAAGVASESLVLVHSDTETSSSSQPLFPPTDVLPINVTNGHANVTEAAGNGQPIEASPSSLDISRVRFPQLGDSDEQQVLQTMKKKVDEEQDAEAKELMMIQNNVKQMDSEILDQVAKLAMVTAANSSLITNASAFAMQTVRSAVTKLTQTMNGTIQTTLHALEDRNKLIKSLIEREEDAILTRQQKKMDIDYDTGMVKTQNGSFVQPFLDMMQRLKHSVDTEEDPFVADPAVLQEDFVFLTDFVTLLAASTLGGLIAVFLRLPVFVGFIAGGMVVGPTGLNLIQRLKYIETLSQVGGPLLLFVQGLSLQSTAVAPITRRFLWGLLLQLMTITVSMMTLMYWSGIAHSTSELFLLSLCSAVSSSAVSLKIAEDQYHHRTLYYKILISLAVIQDLIMALLLCIPAALHEGYMGIFVLFKQLIYVAILVSASVIATVKVIPRVIRYFVHRNNPELFLLSMVTLCLSYASFTRSLGLSTEFGAFFAGLLLTRTSLVQEALQRIDPIKDVFCALFFASIGLVISSMFILKNLKLIIAMFLAVFILKCLTSYMLLRSSGTNSNSAMLISLCMAEIGEFSIFVAGNGFTIGIISRKAYLLFLAVTVFSLVMTPLIFKLILRFTSIKPTLTKNVVALSDFNDIEMGAVKHTPTSTPHNGRRFSAHPHV